MAIMGESGSGKTTLLNILASWISDRGKSVSERKRSVQGKGKGACCVSAAESRVRVSGLNLLDTFSLKDNIFLPLVLSGKKYDEMEKKIKPIAQRLGIEKLLEKYPYEVSGGQKQRAAIARAIITRPPADPGRRAYRRAGF